jgi:hypothetical protein
MKIIFSLLFIISTTFCLKAQTIQYTQTIKGTVVDEQSGNVLSNVTVMLDGSNSIAAITDSTGVFKLFNIPIGRQGVRASFSGYEPAMVQNIEVTSSKEVVLEIRMKE